MRGLCSSSSVCSAMYSVEFDPAEWKPGRLYLLLPQNLNLHSSVPTAVQPAELSYTLCVCTTESAWSDIIVVYLAYERGWAKSMGHEIALVLLIPSIWGCVVQKDEH